MTGPVHIVTLDTGETVVVPVPPPAEILVELPVTLEGERISAETRAILLGGQRQLSFETTATAIFLALCVLAVLAMSAIAIVKAVIS